MPTVRLTLHTEPADLQIRRTPPRIDIERTPPEVRVQRREPQVRLQRDEYEGAVGVLRPAALATRIAGDARAAADEAIGQISAEGDTLMRIENRGNAIKSIAEQKLAREPVELVLNMVPPAKFRVSGSSGVAIEGRPGTLTMRARLTPLEIEFTPARVVADTEVPSKLDVTA